MNTPLLSARLPLLLIFSVTLVAATHGALIHRYSFNDGSARDLAGNADGKLQGPGARIADGKLVFQENTTVYGHQASCLEFSSSILPSGGTSVSIVVWFNARAVGAFARVLNIGASEGTEGTHFIYFSPNTADGYSRVAITGSDVNAKTYIDFEPLDDGNPHMVAIVIDGAAKKLRVFVDGKEPRAAENLGTNTLDKVKPLQNWLGRSSFAADPGFTGAIDEVRVYDHALSPEECATINQAGPNALP